MTNKELFEKYNGCAFEVPDAGKFGYIVGFQNKIFNTPTVIGVLVTGHGWKREFADPKPEIRNIELFNKYYSSNRRLWNINESFIIKVPFKMPITDADIKELAESYANNCKVEAEDVKEYLVNGFIAGITAYKNFKN